LVVVQTVELVTSIQGTMGGFPNPCPNGTLRAMNSRFLLVFVFLSFCPHVAAQRADMSEWLNTGTKEERVKRLVSLGVERKTADDEPLSLEPKIGWLPIRNETSQRYAILFLPCATGMDEANLYLMKSDSGKWQIGDHVEVDCHYDFSVSVEISPIRKSTVDEVLVHHAGAGRGTGISLQDFEVFDVFEGKLKLVLDVEEVVNESRTPIGSYDLLQRSIFVAIPTVGSQSRVIEETRSSNLNGKLTVQRRIFRWDESKSCYQPSRFSSVENRDK
jgi:hypothetical protein